MYALCWEADDWPHAYVLEQLHGVVYFVDAVDKERFVESRGELDTLLQDEVLAGVCTHSPPALSSEWTQRCM